MSDVQVYQSQDVATWAGLCYGNPGLGKTFFAASFPKPMKVFMFDPPAKGLAYLQQGLAQPRLALENGGEMQFVLDEKGKLLVEVEFFYDKKPQDIGSQPGPCAYERFQDALSGHMDDGWMTAESEPRPYASVIMDSYTFCESACYRMIQFKVNPAPGGVKDSKHNQMQWSGDAAGILMTDIVSQWPWIPCHSLILAHVNDTRFDEQDKQLYGISAIGKKLPKSMPAAFAEMYMLYRTYNEKEKRYENWLLTESDGVYMAQTHIGAPNHCKAEWGELWK